MNAENNKQNISEDAFSFSRHNRYDVSISELIPVLVNKIWIIVLAGLVAVVISFFLTSESATPTYRSTARVYILNRQNSYGTTMTDLNSAGTLKEDFRVLIRSKDVFRKVLARIGEDEKNYKSLNGKLSLDNNETRFVDITITDTDPIRAKALADAFADVSRIKAKEIMGVEDITIEEYGEIPTTPHAPDMEYNLVVAAIIGVIISSGIIVLLYIFNDNIRKTEDIEKHIGVCVLGSIPDVSLLRRVKKKNNKASRK